MQLADGPRQIVAALLASAGFVGLFFGAGLVWWLALVLAIAVYAAGLLLIRRRRPLNEIKLTARVSAEDVANAAELLADAGRRIEAVTDTAPGTEQETLVAIREDLAVIRQNILDDPEDLRATRSFLNVQLPEIVKAIEAYVRVSRQATADTQPRIVALGTQIRGFAAPIRRIREATTENDLHALGIELTVLEKTLKRH